MDGRTTWPPPLTTTPGLLRPPQYALKSKRTVLVVIGNSTVQELMIPTDQFLETIVETVGLEVVEIPLLRAV